MDPTTYVNTDPITFKMLLLRQGASDSWVVHLQHFGFIRFCKSPKKRLQNTPSFVARVTNTLQRRWCAKHFVRTRYALVTVKAKVT